MPDSHGTAPACRGAICMPDTDPGRAAHGAKMVTCSQLNQEILEGIFSGETLIVRVPDFLDKDAAVRLADALAEHIDADASGGIYESDVMSFWSASREPSSLDTYFSTALPLQRRLRMLSAPYPSPIDLLRTMLDEAWPGGGVLMSIAGRKMPFGITRLWQDGSEALPHQDVIWREFKDNPMIVNFEGQIGVNIYLDTSVRGGELESWDFAVSDDNYQVIEQQYPGSYGYPRTMLPEYSVLVSPQIGDLILVNTLKVHSVRKIESGRRLTLSGFVARSTKDQPLRFWS